MFKSVGSELLVKSAKEYVRKKSSSYHRQLSFESCAIEWNKDIQLYHCVSILYTLVTYHAKNMNNRGEIKIKLKYYYKITMVVVTTVFIFQIFLTYPPFMLYVRTTTTPIARENDHYTLSSSTPSQWNIVMGQINSTSKINLVSNIPQAILRQFFKKEKHLKIF